MRAGRDRRPGGRVPRAFLAATALVAATASPAAAFPATASPVTASQAIAGGKPAAIAWTPCPDRPVTECGTLTRPIDPERPELGTFPMALARHRATDPARRVGVLVVNPGGPGQSGVDFASGARWYFSPEVLARFDVVGFDPRGVGDSQPVRCSVELQFGGPGTHPTDRTGFERLREHNRLLREDCARHSGPIIDHVSTEEVVGDVDALRQALGEDRISYYGLSYGTVIGQRYAERHGDRVRAMLLDSVVDRGVDAREHVAASARAAADVLARWLRWNERTASSPLHGRDAGALWDELMASAARGELADPDDPTRRITPHDLSGNLTASAYLPDWEGFSAWVLALRDGAPAARAASRAAGGDPSLFATAFQAITCADLGFRVRSHAEYAALTRLENRISPRTAGSLRGNTAMTGCLGVPDTRTPQRPGAMRTAVPTLLLNSGHDPSTPHEWAVAVRRQQPRSTVLVTYEGDGHGVYDRSDCTRRVGDDYLLSLSLPSDGTTCPAVDE
ncbi:pimeloyl-ACP methyl ester carboxylesterase [Saccharothrix coeruleofusca]|uniref:alpha/beta fold hydrolase n=1 Tax=Saccharothrix coeruleofusca TaxID=33919 RepID=UPI001AE34FCA|nr:alpha/beta fold hydrolase [Saccharothrix coeruleofusca]MBP2338860.1 pimeloyl-ACP methyl ester carboxylesterase [Saccharothrix coeruleofusca]